MANPSVSQSQVARLKELLFEPENEAITKLSRRVEEVFERAGTEARFEASVSRTIDGALRAAEVEKHAEVSGALAPLVVKTVKREIGNSTDELVEALYPATGRMVRAYVANAIKELTDGINRRLEENPLMLRLSAWAAGRSMAELALADSQRPRIEDVFLIRRATGELLGRWPQLGSSNLDHVFGGVLTAINDFTSEAFKTQGTSLRAIDLGAERVYLRASPSYLLAARCSGADTMAAERIFDEEFLALVDRWRVDLEAASRMDRREEAAPAVEPLLEELSGRLKLRLDMTAPMNAGMKKGVRPLTLLALIVGLPLLGWLSWSVYNHWQEASVYDTARGIVDATPQMNGYPAEIRVASGARSLTIAGLAPSAEVEAAVLRRIGAALPGVAIVDKLNAVPVGTDFRPAIAELRDGQSAFEAEVKAATSRTLRARATATLASAGLALASEADALTGTDAARLSGWAAEAREIVESVDGTGRDPAGDVALARKAIDLEGRLAMAAREILDVESSSKPPLGIASAAADIMAALDRLSVAAHTVAERSATKRRLALETSALRSETVQLRAETTALRAEIEALSKPRATPREALVAFAQSHAIFFSEATTFRDPVAAARIIDQLAALMARDNSLVRVVGYTDEAGTPAANSALSLSRSEAVKAELMARGTPANRLVALRRTSAETAVTPVTGAGSSNRRVEFEVGFVGEGGD